MKQKKGETLWGKETKKTKNISSSLSTKKKIQMTRFVFDVIEVHQNKTSVQTVNKIAIPILVLRKFKQECFGRSLSCCKFVALSVAYPKHKFQKVLTLPMHTLPKSTPVDTLELNFNYHAVNGCNVMLKLQALDGNFQQLYHKIYCGTINVDHILESLLSCPDLFRLLQ